MGEIFVEGLIFFLKCIFWYPFAIPYWIGRSIYRRYQNRELPIPTRDQSRPPTPAETAQAQTQLRIAYSLIEVARADDKGILGNLNKAAKALTIARNLDANAEIPVPDGRGAMTVDTLSGYALFMEAHYFANNYQYQDDWQDRHYQNRDQRQGLEAINKAVKYDPKQAQFWAVKARLHKNLGQKAEGRAAAQKAVELDHTNGDALTLLGQLQ